MSPFSQWVTFIGARDGLPHLFNLNQCVHIGPAEYKGETLVEIDGHIVRSTVEYLAAVILQAQVLPPDSASAP